MRFPLKFSREVSFASFLFFTKACPSDSIAVISSITLFKYLKRNHLKNHKRYVNVVYFYTFFYALNSITLHTFLLQIMNDDVFNIYFCVNTSRFYLRTFQIKIHYAHHVNAK